MSEKQSISSSDLLKMVAQHIAVCWERAAATNGTLEAAAWEVRAREWEDLALEISKQEPDIAAVIPAQWRYLIGLGRSDP